MPQLTSPPAVTGTPERVWWPLVAACVGTFLLLVYATIVTVALPRMALELHAGFGALQWIVDVFTVLLAGTLLGLGSLSDALGRKRVYVAGLVGFSLATLACGLSVSTGMLIAARAVQGICAAAMFATILPLVALTYRGKDRATAFAVWGTVAGVASAIGTLSGGVIAQFLGWRWIFLLSLPICAVAIVLAARSFAESPPTGHKVDVAGMVTLSIATTALTYAIISGGEAGWTAATTVTGWVVSVVAAGLFVVIQRRTLAPVLPPALFGTRGFVGVLLVAFGYYFAAFGALPVLSLWLQDSTGLSSAGTSLALASQVVVFVVVSALFSARFHGRSPARVLGGATVLIGVGCLSAALILALPSWLALLPAFVLTGIGAGIVSPVFPAVAIAAVPPAFGATAGAAANGARQLGLALGIALCGVIFAATGHFSPTAGLLNAMVCCGVLALVTGALGGWLLRRGVG
ncbi:MFS transporter [Fodinicola acaciae]|uniref:MFS transporter n=1 Tax=Fodinicola acaciae TaxID=2681555 RepID=UPI0013D47045|nr:MFS transporter [Fodinicola acaciae]